jgi:exodeoxyribonuclease-3
LEHQFAAQTAGPLFAWLEATQPDIVCLQETKCPDEQFPALALQAAGYRSAYHGEKSYNGVAILAKNELHEVRASLCDEVVDPQARVIAATVGQLRVFSIYAPNGQAVGSRRMNINCSGIGGSETALRKKISRPRRVRRFQCRSGGHRCLRRRPLARGHHGFGRRTRAFRDLCSLGLHDTLRIHHKEGELFSWWDYQMRAFEKNRGLRIDAVLTSESLAKKCIASGIDREMRAGKDPSDHAPVWAEFAMTFIPSEVEDPWITLVHCGILRLRFAQNDAIH